MADEVVNQDAPKTTDLVAEIGEEGTLASIQARSNRVRFDSETGGLKEEPVNQPGQEGGEPEDKAAAGEAGAKTGGGEGEQKEEPKLKYKSQEDAEAAQKEAERKMHEATTQAAKEKEAREAVEREAAELKTKLEEALAKSQEKPAEGEQKPMATGDRKAKVRAATKAALTTIRELDRTADDYDEKVEEAWAEALLEAGMTGTPLTQAEIDKMVKDSMTAAQKAQKEADDKAEQTSSAERAWQAALDQGKKAGLNLDDEDSADFMLFDAIERRLATKGLPDELKGKQLPEVVEYMIKEVRRRTGKVVADTEKERERARKTQINNSVLTKGVTPPPERAEESKPYTLAELQRQDKERRMARQRGA
jgi:hypothetical protein